MWFRPKLRPYLRSLLDAIARGELTAPGPMIAHLRGSLAALEALERPSERADSRQHIHNNDRFSVKLVDVGDGDRVVGYVRVSTEEQGQSGAGLAAQRRAIKAECERRGWQLVRIEEDVLSGRTLNRPGLNSALEACRSGEVSGIVVAKLDRLSRSLVDFAGLLAEAQSKGFNVVALDLGVDLSTPAGEFLASVMASAAQWERRIIGQRTKDALAIRGSRA